MPRIDDYIASRDLVVAQLAAEPFSDIASRAAFSTEGMHLFIIPFLDRTYQVTFPDFSFRDREAPEKEVPIQEQVLILHYLAGSKAQTPFGRWVSYREIPGASFYYSAFVKRAVEPMKKSFGPDLPGFKRAAEKLGAMAIQEGDASFQLSPFPKVPMQLILWAGDAEFPPEANILFDGSVGAILSPEDVAWLAGMTVYRLMALSRSF